MRLALLATLMLLAGPVFAQEASTTPERPGQPDTGAVVAGTYAVDPAHTQVLWAVDHIGLSELAGMFGASEGSLTIDPANLSASAVDVTIPIEGIAVTFAPFAEHLMGGDFFAAEEHPTARFVSTAVAADEDGTATITGDLTIKDVTREITMEARFFGAGINPRDKKLHVGFEGTATVLRSEFDLGAYAPVVSDEVELEINAAFIARTQDRFPSSAPEGQQSPRR